MLNIRKRDRFNDLWWGPWSELNQLHHDLDQMFFGDGRGPGFRRPQKSAPLNVWTNDDGALVRVAVPGFDADNLNIEVEGNVVHFSGTRDELDQDEIGETRLREFGQIVFERAIELPFNVDAEAVDAKLDAGVLQVKLPRAEADKPRRIAVRGEA